MHHLTPLSPSYTSQQNSSAHAVADGAFACAATAPSDTHSIAASSKRAATHPPSPPPPPLDRVALTLAPDEEWWFSHHDRERHAFPESTNKHRGVAAHALQRIVTQQAIQVAAKSPAEALLLHPSAPAAATRVSASGAVASSFEVTKKLIHVTPPHPPRDAHRQAGEEEEEGEEGDAHSGKDHGKLPWWQRILVDAAYRQRLMHLSTEGYRAELRLLQESPELVSGSAGLEQRKVWRERRWWADSLENEMVRRTDKHGNELLPASDEVDRSRTARETATGDIRECAAKDSIPAVPSSSSASAAAAAGANVEAIRETVVMAQHVVFCLPPLTTLSSIFSAQHPRSIMASSSLATVRRVALGAMPPVRNVREQQSQESAVNAYLGAQRRFSRDMPLTVKQRLARDIVAGRRAIPMHTAITEAVLAPANAAAGKARARQATHGSSASRSHAGGAKADNATPGKSGTDDHATLPIDTPGINESRSAVVIPLIPKPPPTPPITPPWLRRRLPPGARAVHTAHHAAIRAEIAIRTSGLQPGLPPAERQSSANRADGAQKRTGRDTRQTTHEALRALEAAAACTNGIENLYGLHYVWRLPLPPSGFLRVTPDPRQAMWPEDDEVTEYGALLHERYYSAGATTTAHNSSSNAYEAVPGGRHHHRRREMRRLARKVNQRTRKLRWLHAIGRQSMRYEDLVVLTDSDSGDTSTSPSVSSETAEDVPDDAGFSSQMHRRMRRNELAQNKTRGGAQKRVKGNGPLPASPIYDGPLNINIYVEEPNSSRRAAALSGADANGVTTAVSSAVKNGRAEAAGAARNTGARDTHRTFLGCYRQSRLLIHFKLYCRALHEEARLRGGPALTHVVGCPPAGVSSSSRLLDDFPRLLRHVPVIPYPVLRVQAHPPSLRQPHARETPRPSSISEARCWEGLFPSVPVDLTAPSHQVWRRLRESMLIQQALRDIYEDLPHDREGLLDKRTFVLFVLQLLELFFPTHLQATVHVAIAEEEWLYRGTTEHVGPQTFHEKFFGFPFVFHRDIAAVTETDVVEFWSLVRVCLTAQQKQQDGEHVDAEDLLLSLHLLVPLTSLTSDQLRTLLSHPPPAFDPVGYDRYCLLTHAFHCDPMVHAAPPARQYAVAHARVEAQLRQRYGKPKLSLMEQKEDARAAAAAAATFSSDTATPGTVAYPKRAEGDTNAEAEERASAATVSLSSQGFGVESIAHRERDERQRRVQAQEKVTLLENSAYFQHRQRRVLSREAAALSRIESTTSTWELHQANVYEPPSPKRGDAPGFDVKRQAPMDRATADDPDADEALLRYLEDVPLDAFDGHVSLRQRFLRHTDYLAERHRAEPPSLLSQHPPPHRRGTRDPFDTFGPPNVKSRDGPSERANAQTAARAPATSPELESFKDASTPVIAATTAGAAPPPPPPSVITTSYATGMYPLRPMQRTFSTVLGPADPQARLRILRRKSYRLQTAPAGSTARDTRDETEAALPRVSSARRSTLRRRRITNTNTNTTAFPKKAASPAFEYKSGPGGASSHSRRRLPSRSRPH